jgi:ADP-heptose:LPS heptosyltransferase
MLCAVPALRALRQALPAAEITLIGLPWAEAFARRVGRYIDRFIAVPGHPGLPEQPAARGAFDSFCGEVRREAFDLVIQAHGDGRITNGIVAGFGANAMAGFHPSGTSPPSVQGFIAWPETGHEASRLGQLVAALGAPASHLSLEFPLLAVDMAEYLQLPGLGDLRAGRYVCIHPGARLPSRRWPAGRLGAVARALSDAGMRVVITGTASESTLAAEVRRAAGASALDLTGRTTMGSLGLLFAGAALVVCNDTGVSHVAAALREPSVVIACGSEVERWAPLDRSLHRVLWQPVDCRPCAYMDCPIPGHPCAGGVTSGAVAAEALALLGAVNGGRQGFCAEPVAGPREALFQ